MREQKSEVKNSIDVNYEASGCEGRGDGGGEERGGDDDGAEGERGESSGGVNERG